MSKPAALATTALAVAGLFGLASCGGNSSTPAQGEAVKAPASATALQNQLVDVAKSVSPEVVEVQCGRRLGSGVVYDGRGDVVTNAHVLGSASSCDVTLSGGDQHTAKLVGSETKSDLAVVRLSHATPQPAAFADSSKAEVGDMVLAMGNPLGLRSSVTLGIVSSLDRNVAETSTVELTALIQTSADINPGNSGGALVNLSGQVLGIPTLTATDPEFGNTPAPGIGFAIPSNTVRRVASALIASG